jgi:hypothetical protein
MSRSHEVTQFSAPHLDVPVRGMLGGLHLPVHPLGPPLVPQAALGSPHWPWRPIGERDAGHVPDEITARGSRLVALSSHDGTPWTYGAFAHRFGDRHRTLRAGEELPISRPRPRRGPRAARLQSVADRGSPY